MGYSPPDTDTVEEERPGVANDPTVLGDTPTAHQHDETDKHDGGVLDKTPATAEPITDDTDEDLTTNDTTDFEVVDRVDPCLVADLVRLPAVGEGGLEEGLQVTDGEQYVTFETETSTGQDHVAEVETDGSERVILENLPEGGEFASGFNSVLLAHEGDSLHDGEIGPVDALWVVHVSGFEEILEDLLLVGGHVDVGVFVGTVGAIDIGPVRRIGAITSDVVLTISSHNEGGWLLSQLHRDTVQICRKKEDWESGKGREERQGSYFMRGRIVSSSSR